MKQISLSAKIYSDALVQLGQDNVMSFDEILSNLKMVFEVCKNSKDLYSVLENPSISLESKFAIIDEIFSDSINAKIVDFLKIIIEKKRFFEFEQIIYAFENALDEINKIKRISIISAIELNDDKKQIVTEKLRQKFNKEILADWSVDKDIISGLVFKIDDTVIDGSLKNKLENLSKNIKGNL